METTAVCPGVNLRVIRDTKFKTNTISLCFHIPLRRETVTLAALLPSVLKRGTEKYPRFQDMARRLADLYSASCGAGVRLKGEGEVLYFSAEYIADAYVDTDLTGPVADFLGELVFAPLVQEGGFLPAYVEGEKTNLKNAILGLINDKREYADVKCREAMFGREGYGIFEAGYAEDLDGITPAGLYGFYRQVLETARVDIVLSGSVTPEMAAAVQKTLGARLAPRTADYCRCEPAVTRRKEPQVVVEELPTVQSKLSMGLCCGVEPTGEDYYALMLGSCIFGSSPFSKLFNNVREKLSLAYYAACRTDRLKSVMLISAGIETCNFQAAYDEILVQLGKMQAGEITEAEMAAAKKYLATNLASLRDSMRATEDYYLGQLILGQEQSLEELLERLQAVTREQVQRVMQGVKLDTVYFLKGTLETGKEETYGD